MLSTKSISIFSSEIFNSGLFVPDRFFELSITYKNIKNHFFSPKNGQKLGWQMGHSAIHGILCSNFIKVFCTFQPDLQKSVKIENVYLYTIF